VPSTFAEAQGWATAFAQSGLFNDVKGAAQCVVKIQAGAELAIPPFASMNGVHIISGKTSLSANLMAAVIKRSKVYNYRTTEHTDKSCTIKFYELSLDRTKWEEVGT